MKKGVIRLYFDGELITSLNFNSVENRKYLMQRLNETYQLNRQRKIVYFEITAI